MSRLIYHVIVSSLIGLRLIGLVVFESCIIFSLVDYLFTKCELEKAIHETNGAIWSALFLVVARHINAAGEQRKWLPVNESEPITVKTWG